MMLELLRIYSYFVTYLNLTYDIVLFTQCFPRIHLSVLNCPSINVPVSTIAVHG